MYDSITACATAASAHCDASAAAPDTAFTPTQQFDSIKSRVGNLFAEPSGLPPVRGAEHAIPLELDAQPAFKCM